MNLKKLLGDNGHLWTVLAFFGGEIEGQIARSLLATSLEVHRGLGVEVNAAAFHTVSRFGRYKKVRPIAAESIAKGPELVGFSVGHTAGLGADLIEEGDTIFEAFRYAFVMCGKDTLFRPTPEGLNSIADKVRASYEYTYAYSYRINKCYGPTFHAVGMIYHQVSGAVDVPLSAQEVSRASRWARSLRSGDHLSKLRDVYPWNVLSSNHLSLQVGGVSLRNWIESDLRNGHIQAIGDDRWLWIVSEDRCVAITAVLESTGVI